MESRYCSDSERIDNLTISIDREQRQYSEPERRVVEISYDSRETDHERFEDRKHDGRSHYAEHAQNSRERSPHRSRERYYIERPVKYNDDDEIYDHDKGRIHYSSSHREDESHYSGRIRDNYTEHRRSDDYCHSRDLNEHTRTNKEYHNTPSNHNHENHGGLDYMDHQSQYHDQSQ